MPPKKTNEATAAGKATKDAGRAKEKARKAEKRFIFKHIGQTDKVWNVAALPVIATLLLCLSVTLVIVGAVKDIKDLIILGSLFILGSIVFYVIMYCKVCRPMCQRNIVKNYEFTDDLRLQEVEEARPATTASENVYYNAMFENDTEVLTGKDRPPPTETDLYPRNTHSAKLRQTIGTPATTSNLKLYEDDQDDVTRTPLPPRLALPSDPSDSNNAVFTMDVEKEMAKHTREMSNLELL